MALPSTGSISMSQVNTELKKSSTATISLNDSDVRKLAGKTSGTISMGDLRGKKASESVNDYQIYSNSWEGRRAQGSFSFNFPHKVISGYITVSVSSDGNSEHGYVVIFGHKVVFDPVKINISNLSSINGTYYTGSKANPNGVSMISRVSVNIKFTGEWEL